MSDLREKKKYVRPVIKLIELALGESEGSMPLLQAAAPPTSTSNVAGGTVFGAARRRRGGPDSP
jgi:hypothetical protein